MRKILWVVLAFATSAIAADGCFLSSERVSGMNKICTYKCTSGEKSITIKSTELCPLSL